MSRRRFVILDRDGTLIFERNYLCDPRGVELLPGAKAALHQLRELGLGLIVVTNQSGIGRGYFDFAQLDAVHSRLKELLAADGLWLDGIYCCPHLPDDNCACRKPKTGLLLQAASEHGFSPEECVVIGDKPCDIDLGRAVGALSVWVRTGHGARLAAMDAGRADAVVDGLEQAARFIRGYLGALPSS
jgi:D-glycero-D-manno-heptose 1,7-bisphosphate phosphatase